MQRAVDADVDAAVKRALRLLEDEALAAAERQHVLDERAGRAERELVARRRRLVQLNPARGDHSTVAPELVLVIARRSHRPERTYRDSGWSV